MREDRSLRFHHRRDYVVRTAACEALGKIGGPEAVDLLCKALEDPWLRVAAAAGLGRIGDKSALAPLKARLTVEKVSVALEALLGVIVALGGAP